MILIIDETIINGRIVLDDTVNPLQLPRLK